MKQGTIILTFLVSIPLYSALTNHWIGDGIAIAWGSLAWLMVFSLFEDLKKRANKK